MASTRSHRAAIIIAVAGLFVAAVAVGFIVRHMVATSELPMISDAHPAPLGTVQQAAGGLATVTAMAIDRAVPPESFSATTEPRTAVELHACANSSPISVSASPWWLYDPADGQYAPVAFTGEPKLPAYPGFGEDRTLASNECITGWLIMDIPAQTEVAGVRYSLPDGTVLRWSA